MYISPMLLATAPAAFSSPDYIFEPKIAEVLRGGEGTRHQGKNPAWLTNTAPGGNAARSCSSTR